MGIFFPPDPNMPRIFLDASVIISGIASRTGGSHALLVLAEIGLIRPVICQYIFQEVERNIQAKLPKAIPNFDLLKANIPGKLCQMLPMPKSCLGSPLFAPKMLLFWQPQSKPNLSGLSH